MQNVKVAGEVYYEKSIKMQNLGIRIGGKGKDLVLKWSLIGIEHLT